MKRKTKRLLARFLALVMVLSLCEITLGQSTPAKAAISLQNPTTNGNGVTTWDCIYFGNYWQNDTNGDGKADQNDQKNQLNGESFPCMTKKLDANCIMRKCECVGQRVK